MAWPKLCCVMHHRPCCCQVHGCVEPATYCTPKSIVLAYITHTELCMKPPLSLRHISHNSKANQNYVALLSTHTSLEFITPQVEIRTGHLCWMMTVTESDIELMWGMFYQNYAMERSECFSSMELICGCVKGRPSFSKVFYHALLWEVLCIVLSSRYQNSNICNA